MNVDEEKRLGAASTTVSTNGGADKPEVVEVDWEENDPEVSEAWLSEYPA